MQIKWLEDFVLLAQTGSFTRAAELRHVTHPAFGRRIRALEEWAGTALIGRGPGPLVLTPAGQSLLEDARSTLQGLARAHEALQGAAGRQQRRITLATGRTLARTLVADWLLQHQGLLAEAEVCVRTRALADTARMLERGEADFMLTYHHPVLALNIHARQYSHLTLMRDRLVPVCRSDALGRPAPALAPGQAWPFLAYADTLALGRLVQDHLSHHPQAPELVRRIECDSADALLEYALKGLGVAWLPWSLAAGSCRSGQLCTVGDPRLAVQFEVRLYRPKRRLPPLAEQLWQATADAL
ncbi:MAG: LysR family transcriptional regulator [Curvibacter sp.]|nr:LysR family transcriptional regulator [Curvibacter sp.]